MKLKYLHLLIAIFIIMLYSTTAMATQNNHIVMRFAAGSDLHSNLRDPETSWKNDLNNFINWSNNEHNSSSGLNYTFFNGDMFYNSNSQSEAIFTMRYLQYNYFNKLQSPYHYVIGNNERLNNSTFYRSLNYSTDSVIIDGGFAFVFLNSSNYNIANPAYLESALDKYASKKVFVLIHVSQIGSPYDGHYAVINQTFIDIINSHPNVVTVINGHNHGVNTCHQNYTSIYNCWDGCLNSKGDSFSGARIFEVYDDGQVLTYEYSLTTNQIVNMDIIYPLDTNKTTSGQEIYLGHRLNNTITPDGNVTYSRPVYTNTDSAVNMTVIPSSGTVDVSVSKWNTSENYEKIWNESVSNNSITTQYKIGSFPAGELITISRDGDYYETVQSNSTGYIKWTYTEGYGDHTLDATLSSSQNTPMDTMSKEAEDKNIQKCRNDQIDNYTVNIDGN